MNDSSKFGTRALFVAAVAFFAIGFIVGDTVNFRLSEIERTPPTDAGVPEGADLTPLFKAWKLLDENFVPATSSEPVMVEEKVFGTIEGLAASYGDPYTVFFPPREKGIFESQVQGDFSGVGMEIGIKNGFLTVVAPLKGTPAERAGVKSGDIILMIDGTETLGMSVDDAVARIRGERGTPVMLELQREGGEPFEVTIIRDTITLPTVDTALRSDGVFVINLYSFNALAPLRFREALREFAISGSNKLVIDLRSNPGGFLEVAVDMASWFLPVGEVIVIEDYGQKRPAHVERSRGYDVFNDTLRLAILIDEGSASASEIFAGALRDYGKATLIGERSFGKGSVQQLFDVTDRTSLKVTVARWLTPKGVSISHDGITPDIEVAASENDEAEERDVQLERAAEFLKTGK